MSSQLITYTILIITISIVTSSFPLAKDINRPNIRRNKTIHYNSVDHHNTTNNINIFNHMSIPIRSINIDDSSMAKCIVIGVVSFVCIFALVYIIYICKRKSYFNKRRYDHICGYGCNECHYKWN